MSYNHTSHLTIFISWYLLWCLKKRVFKLYTDDRFDVDPKRLEDEENQIWDSFYDIIGVKANKNDNHIGEESQPNDK